jgi:hypothetical protein
VSEHLPLLKSRAGETDLLKRPDSQWWKALARSSLAFGRDYLTIGQGPTAMLLRFLPTQALKTACALCPTSCEWPWQDAILLCRRMRMSRQETTTGEDMMTELCNDGRNPYSYGCRDSLNQAIPALPDPLGSGRRFRKS